MTDLDASVEAALGAPVVARRELDGGMIGRVYRVELADGRTVVAKTGGTPLAVEGRMLRYLARHAELPVPDVYHADDDLLCIEFLPGESTITPAVERDAAAHLAALHGVTADAFGFPFDTLTGPVPQPNPRTDRWIPFYRDKRLEHVLALAEGDEESALTPSLAARVRAVCAELSDLIEEPAAPALIHGDVWRTNLLTDGERVVAFLDPACYFAHPEVELAYADWTDTFGEPFFERYRRERGVDLDGFFERRRHVYRLYPLLVHVHLFGESYVEPLEATLARLGY